MEGGTGKFPHNKGKIYVSSSSLALCHIIEDWVFSKPLWFLKCQVPSVGLWYIKWGGSHWLSYDRWLIDETRPWHPHRFQ